VEIQKKLKYQKEGQTTYIKMEIEISEKEKTALSILLGLRKKFAREKKTNEVYSASELYRMFSETIRKINREELDFLGTLVQMHKPEVKNEDEVWGVVDDAVDRSKIKRYDWNKVFGRSLTQEILFLKKEGMSVEETFNKLCLDPRVTQFLVSKPRQQKKIIENLKISTHARYGENNTAAKVMNDDE